MIAIVVDKNNKETKRIIDPSPRWIVKQLETYTCQVLFRKKLNGQFRSLKCTRNFEKLPSEYESLIHGVIENPHGYKDIIPVWDISSREWKSFYYDSIYAFKVLLGE
jgi:hypothetical protein